MKIKQLSLAVAVTAAFIPAFVSSTSASANSTNTIVSTSNVADATYVRKGAAGATYNFGGTPRNMTFGKKTHYLKNYPNTTWHVSQKRYVIKKNGTKYLYFYVTNGRGTVSGWIWHGYLQKKGAATTTPAVTTSDTSYEHTAADKVSTGSGNYAALLRAAKAQLGKPYVYGGNGASSFDCSGFTKYVFNQTLGQTLPRTAQAQYDSYKHVSAANAQPGDLIFFGSSAANISHVGIYMGNHEMIDAQLRGVVVEKTNVSWWHTVGYSRPADLN